MILTNKYQQLKHEIRKLWIISRGAFLIGMCGHWTSKNFKCVCVVVKNNSSDKSNKTQTGKKVMFMETNRFVQHCFSIHKFVLWILLSVLWNCHLWQKEPPKGSHSVWKNSTEGGFSVQLKGWGKVFPRVLWLCTSQPFRVMDFPHLCLTRSCSLFYSGPKASGRVFMCWLCVVPIHNCVVLKALHRPSCNG